jgi:hypothetical protein
MTLGCCCIDCECDLLTDYLQADTVSIPGYSRLTDWEPFSTGWQPPIGENPPPSCCYRAFFGKDNCEVTKECRSCNFTGVREYIWPCFPNDVHLFDTTNNGSQVETSSGCVLEVRIIRYDVGINQCTRTSPKTRCKVAIYAGWRDYIVFREIIQHAGGSGVSRLLPPCPIPDPPEGQCYAAPVCILECELSNDPACQSRESLSYYNATWGYAIYFYAWWRVRVFNGMPSGTICFTDSDIDLELCERPLNTCLNEFYPLAPVEPPRFPTGGTLETLCANTGIGSQLGPGAGQWLPFQNFLESPFSPAALCAKNARQWLDRPSVSVPGTYCIEFAENA